MVGGSSDPSVPWSPGVTLQEKAGRPMGPSTLRCEFPWEVVVVYVGFLFFALESGFCLFVVKPLLFLRGRCLFSGPLSPSRPDPCLASICLSSSFSCMVCSSTPCVLVLVLSLSLSFSLSLSLRRWGTPNLFGLGFPLCFFNLDTLSALDPYVFLFTYTQALPRTCFFFFSSSSLVPGSVFARPGSVGVGFLGGCFFLFCLWSLFSFVRCIARQTLALLSGAGRLDISRPCRFLSSWPFLGNG